jgi:hypothetical protein
MFDVIGGAGAILGLLLWGSWYAYAMRRSGREVDKIRRTGHLEEMWDGIVFKRQLLGTLAVFCIVALVPVEVILLRGGTALISRAGLAVLGLAPTFAYFGYIHGANYVLDNPDDGEIVEARRAARKLRRSR